MNAIKFFSFIFPLILLAAFNEVTISQVNLQKIASYQYAQYDGTWYTVVDGKQGDSVDTKHLIVQLKDKTDIDRFDYAILGLPRLKNLRARFPERFYKLEIPDRVDAFTVARKLEQSGKFQHIVFNIFVKVHAVPNDTQYGNQWNLSKISMSGAWDLNRGSNTILVAIIDGGGDYDHEDLVGNRWPGIGYDTNGEDADPYPYDGSFHGTAVAGVCGAVTNNQLGVAGIAGGWNGVSGIRIMHYRAGWGITINAGDAVEAIVLAADAGARVINMSFGSLTPYTPWQDAISYAVNNYNVVCVASSGNYYPGESTAVNYPAAYTNAIAVGATIQNDNRKELNDGSGDWGSSYGAQLDVVAPGVYIRTTDITGSAGGDQGNYTSFGGTSAASPHVAGIAALILSINPQLTSQQVTDIIRNSADKVSGMGSNNFTNQYGYGRINAYKAVKYTLENHGGTLIQNLTIPSGETWTLATNVVWSFPSGTSLTVNGSLVANSNDPNQRITFTGTSSTPGFWNGIKINSGSGSNVSTLRRCNVSYATTGVTVTYTGNVNSVTLDKCRINNNSSKGVYVNGNGYSSASAHPTLSNSHIHNNSSSGVTVSNYGKPLITGNQINYNSGYGIEATSSYTGTVSYNRVANNGSNGMLFYSSSHAQVYRNTVEANGSGGIYIFSNSNVTAAGGGTNQGRNEITGNTGTGVYANTSSPNFGISNGYNWMQSNTNYEAQMVGSSGYQLRAENCYWGGSAPPASEISGNVDYSPHVTTLPSPIGWGQSDGHDPSYLVQPQPNPIIAITPPQSFYQLMTSRATNGASNDWTRDLIDAINAGLATGDWSQASELITALHRELQDARVPAVEFALVTSYANRHDVASSIRKMLALVLVENDLVENKESAALARLNAFRQSNREHAAEFWANTGVIHLYRQNDVASARNVLAQLQTLAQNGDNIAAEHVVVFGRMIEDYEEDRAGASHELQKPFAAQAHSLPSTPTLTQNYPNPFNPETSIRFHLNQSQNIRLAIYDVNGRHVRSLAAEEFSEGEHVVSWDGRDDQGRQVVSGVYFYELIAEDKVERKKMTVLR